MNMKKILLGAVSLLLAFALTACSGTDIVETTGSTTGTAADTVGEVTTPSVQTTENPETETPETTEIPETTETTTPDVPASKPQIGSGIFEGMFPSDVWDKVLGSLADSTGLDVSVSSRSEYTVGQDSRQEERNVHILLNVGEDSYSYAVESETKRILPESAYTEWSYQAFKDGWFYQSNRTDESGSDVQSSAKIAMTEEALAEQGLDLETILTINAMVGMGMFTVDGQELETIFREVEYVELEDGRSRIVCSGMQTDLIVELLLGSLGDLSASGEGEVDMDALRTLLNTIARLLTCDVTLTIGSTGMPESLHAGISLAMTEALPFALSTEYTLIVNAVGANAGKVTLPEDADQYPEYADFGDFLGVAGGN